MKKTIDARGLACPLPVIQTKDALENLQEGDSTITRVDNEIAVQNLEKFARVRNLSVQSKKNADADYEVEITLGNKQMEVVEEIQCEIPQKENMVVVISSNQMGNGAEELGKTLLKAFIFALTKQDTLPQTMLFYNSGAYITCENSASLEDLKLLQENGVEILTCGTCLNYYGLSDSLQIGGVTNMYDIVEKMEKASKIIKP